MATIPNLNDVLFGKGTWINAHKGNHQFRTIVESYKPRFKKSRRGAEKREVVCLVINEIEKLGGRFLVEHTTDSGKEKLPTIPPAIGANNLVDNASILSKVWVEADKTKVIDKVKHRLREKEKKSPSIRQADQAAKGNDISERKQPPICKSVCPTNGLDNRDSPFGTSAMPCGGGEYQGTNTDTPSSTSSSIAKSALSSINVQEPSVDALSSSRPIFESALSPSINVHHWILSACKLPSKNDYIQSAVHLAWMLTKRIHECMATSAIANLQDYINSENVLIFVDRPALPLNVTSDVPSVSSVRFRFEVPGAQSFPRQAAAHSYSDNASVASSHIAICTALGHALLEIFSVGRSTLADVLGDTTRNNFNNNSCHAQYDQASMMSNPSLSSAKSTVASNVLLEVGMPLSICQLISDLLDAKEEPRPNSALTSIDEVLWDLTQMKENPNSFLFERTCPQQALDDTLLFGNTEDHMFGREKEIKALMDAKDKVSSHVRTQNDIINPMSIQDGNFLCESVFLSGYAGSGKSSLLNSLITACTNEHWFVLGCKFDKAAAPHMTLAKAFDTFFGKWGQSNNANESLNPLKKSFHVICRQIFETLDNDGFDQLCDLLPSFARIFPLLASSSRTSSQGRGGISSMDKVGCGQKRLQNLFHVLFRSLCSAGCPVLFSLDDLQWSGSSVMECLREFVDTDQDASALPRESCRRGILFVGTYRDNEVSASSDLIRNINLMRQSGRTNAIMLNVGELTEVDITKLISAKLCLPFRYTRELAGLVHRKTRGNPYFVTQFLRCVIQNKYLDFSVRKRQWEWDLDVVEMQMISDGVAELLTSTFNQLPSTLMQTMKIVSCLGSQVELCTLDAMNSRNQVLSCNMQDELQRAIQHGLLEQAGPVFQFTHDIVQQTVYDLVPAQSRALLHKTLGMAILESARNNPTLHLIAVDQINMFCKDGVPSPEERSRFAECNAAAAKHAISTSSFDQARSYIDSGLRLLNAHHWVNQYSLSLDLFEMSASVSCMHGDSATLSKCLDQILCNAKTFDDSLKASCLLVQLLSSSGKFEEASSNLLVILSSLGEVFPVNVTLSLLQPELASMQSLLRDLTYDQIKQLPPMTDRKMLNTMQFLSMLRNVCICTKSMMLPLISVRMLKITMEYGLCNESIEGIALAAYTMFLFTEELHLGYRICKISEKLIEDSPSRHVLRSKVCRELFCLKVTVEPCQNVVATFPDLTQSAMLAGDIESATVSRLTYCEGLIFAGTLPAASKNLVLFVRETAKYQQHARSQSAISYLRAILHLTGESNPEDIEIKSYEELSKVAKDTNNEQLAFQNFMSTLFQQFWMGDYNGLVELFDAYPSSEQKRISTIVRVFYEGIVYFHHARKTREKRWRDRGEVIVKKLKIMSQLSACNWQHKYLLLEASLYHVDGDIESAEAAYKASITSAAMNKFIAEEALSVELYGNFLLDNQQQERGLEQLRIAISKYKQWGATTKAKQIEDRIKLIH